MGSESAPPPPFSWLSVHPPNTVIYGDRACPVTTLFPDLPHWAYRRKTVHYVRADHIPGASVTIQFADHPVQSAEVESLDYRAPADISGERVRFTPPGPGHYVVRINACFACFVFIDPGQSDDDLLAGRTIFDARPHLPDDPDEPCTVALQALIDRAGASSGGGVVRLPPGRFTTGTLRMRSGVYLYLDEGTVLQGSTDRSLYPLDEPAKGLSIARSRLLHFCEVEDAGLIGRGCLDGNGSRLRHEALFSGERPKRIPSNLVRIERCRRIRLRDVFLRDSEFWNTHILESDDVALENIRLINEIPPRKWDPVHPDYTWNNADGINPDASRAIRVHNLFAYCGDDCLPVKNTGNAHDPNRGCEDMRFARCTLVSETTVMKIGTETCGPFFKDIVFEDILHLDSGAPMGVILKDGTTLENLTVRRLRGLRCRGAPYLTTQPRRAEQTSPAGRMCGVRFEDWQLDYLREVPGALPIIDLQRPDDLTGLTLKEIRAVAQGDD